MSVSSKIEWTEATWNPTRGCSYVSPGCKNCYAARFAHRLGGPGKPYESLTELTPSGPRWTGCVRVVNSALELPLRWRKPRMVFVDSMSDLFHEEIHLSFIQEVFEIMNQARRHTFQVLTKRAERAFDLSSLLPWPPNVWMGVSIENSAYIDRASYLTKLPAAIRFVSLEPLLGRITALPLEGIHWVILGGESGPGARPMKLEWVREIRNECIANKTPFFFKQWGGVNKISNGRLLDGRTWDEMPNAVR